MRAVRPTASPIHPRTPLDRELFQPLPCRVSRRPAMGNSLRMDNCLHMGNRGNRQATPSPQEIANPPPATPGPVSQFQSSLGHRRTSFLPRGKPCASGDGHRGSCAGGRGLARGGPLADPRSRMVAAAFCPSARDRQVRSSRFPRLTHRRPAPRRRRRRCGSECGTASLPKFAPIMAIIICGQRFATWASAWPLPPCQRTRAWTAISPPGIRTTCTVRRPTASPRSGSPSATGPTRLPPSPFLPWSTARGFGTTVPCCIRSPSGAIVAPGRISSRTADAGDAGDPRQRTPLQRL